MRQQEKKRSSLLFGISSTCASNPMNIFLGITRWIKLHYPIDIRYIQSPSSYRSTEKNPFSEITKLIECLSSLLLFLPTMIIINMDINVVEKIGMMFHGITWGEKHHYLFIQIFLEECHEKTESILRFTHNKTLFKITNCCTFWFVIDTYIKWCVHG